MRIERVRMRTGTATLALLTMAAVGSGCAWREHGRPLRE